MKIIVTGGAGFIGSHLTEELIGRGHDVLVIDNLANGKRENLEEFDHQGRLRFVEADILDSPRMRQLCEGVDVVYHLACLGVRHSLHSPFENHRVNAEGSLVMLEAARNAKVSRFFYISTSEIYGDIRQFPIDENGVPLPKTVYGSSKLAGENYAYSYHACFGMDTVITRIFNNYGPRAHYEGDAGEVIPRSIVNMLYGKAPVIFGDGSVTRDFFYVKDTARVLADLLTKSGLSGEIINIGTGEEITMRSLLSTLIRLMGLENSMSIDFQPDRPADVPRLWVNPAKFKALTGFEKGENFENGLKTTIAYYRQLMNQKDLLKEVVPVNWVKS